MTVKRYVLNIVYKKKKPSVPSSQVLIKNLNYKVQTIRTDTAHFIWG